MNKESVSKPALESNSRPASAARMPDRSPETIMQLARMGSFHATPLSFVRSLIRKMIRENWSIDRTRFDLNDDGFGTAIYTIRTPRGRYDFVAFSDFLDAAERSDRVIAERWDAAFALVDGEADDAAVERLRENVPLQEQGRCGARDLVLSRANKSVRLFEHVADALAAGRQPERDFIRRIGYLMRTTAVYGNGKFGLADFDRMREPGDFSEPFRAQMLAVYVARLFSIDLVEHVAQRRNPAKAIRLSADIKRYFGVGNATGLGMAPFLITHPQLLNRWMSQREAAIARVCALKSVDEASRARILGITQRARLHVEQLETDDAGQIERNRILRDELDAFQNSLPEFAWDSFSQPIAELLVRAQSDSLEFQEILNSIVLEAFPELVDHFGEAMGATELSTIKGAMPVSDLRGAIERYYAWALALDFDQEANHRWFWYRSEDKEEPRVGDRTSEPGADLEMTIATGREVKRLHEALATLDDTTLTARFLLAQPEFRGAVARVQARDDAPFGEIYDNLIGEDCRPIDLLRCKLSMFGASRFDPKSDRWTRITLFQGAPMPDELQAPDAGAWAFPVMANLDANED